MTGLRRTGCSERLGGFEPSQAVAILREVAHHLVQGRDITGAEAYLSRAVSLAQSDKVEDVVSVYCDLGNVLAHKGDLVGAVAAYEQASALGGVPGVACDRARLLSGLGRSMYIQGDWYKAHTLYEEAHTSPGSRTGRCYALLNLAVLYCDRGQYDEAFALDNAVLQELDDLQDELPYHIVLSNMLYKYALTHNGACFEALVDNLSALANSPRFGFLRYDILDTVGLYYLLHNKMDAADTVLQQLSALFHTRHYDAKRGWYIVRELMWLRQSGQADLGLTRYSRHLSAHSIEPFQKGLIHNELALCGAVCGDSITKARAWGRALHIYRKLGVSQTEINQREKQLHEVGTQRRATSCSSTRDYFRTYLGASEGARRTRETLAKIAQTDVTVLMQGESGTGKTFIAHMIHEASPRSKGPFVRFDCTCNDEGLVESLLFGHRRGAFTGAMEARVGLVQKAEGGTLFIDEISELSLAVQGKLLTLCEEGEYRSVGDSGMRKANVRLVVATNRMLKEEAAAGRFRPDLYYRLNAVTVVLEPLRKHPEDIPLLVREWVDVLNERYGRCRTVSCETVWRLQECEWVGNVRELKKMIERGYLMADGSDIELEDMGLSENSSAALGIPTLDVVERQHIRRVLSLVGGNKSKAARVLGVRRTTLYSRMEVLGLVQ